MHRLVLPFLLLTLGACSPRPLTDSEIQATEMAVAADLRSRLLALPYIADVVTLRGTDLGGTSNLIVDGTLRATRELTSAEVQQLIDLTVGHYNLPMGIAYDIVFDEGDRMETRLDATVTITGEANTRNVQTSFESFTSEIMDFRLTEIAATRTPFFPTLTPEAP